MQNNKRTGFAGWMRDKGYYIVLVLCVAAVGISGYLYFSQSTTPDAEAAAAAAMEENAVTAPTEESAGSTASEDGQAPLELQRPIVGEVAETFATDRLAYNATTQDWRVHNGIDLAAEAGTEVCAAADGTVSAVYEDDLMGHIVEITHDGNYMTRYSNLASDIPVAAGDNVVCGTVIGHIGTSAKLEVAEPPHLHFEVYCGELQLNPETCFGN